MLIDPKSLYFFFFNNLQKTNKEVIPQFEQLAQILYSSFRDEQNHRRKSFVPLFDCIVIGRENVYNFQIVNSDPLLFRFNIRI